MRSGVVIYAACFALLPWVSQALAQTPGPEKAADIENCADLMRSATASEVILPPKYKIGDAWSYKNYQVSDGRPNRTWNETVITIDALGAQMQRVDRVAPNNIEGKPYTYRHSLGEGPPFSITKGTRWSRDIIEGGSKIGEEFYSILGCEAVHTDAGDFATLKIKNDFNRGKEKYHTMMWFSPSARSVVKLVYLEKGKPFQATELTSFTLN